METNITEEFETNRQLASVQIVEEIKDHTDSDNLALAKILGWQVVVKRNEFKVGEKVVYFEIDSLLPEAEWSEFMKARNYRIKTIKLRKEISQGLILPLAIISKDINPDDYEVGDNLTKPLNVKKYENDANECIQINGINISNFPSEHVDKSDEPRIQSSPKLINSFVDKAYYATLKYDGTSATYLINPDDKTELFICSRNLKRNYDPTDVYSVAADMYKIKDKLLDADCRYAIQCEIYGPKISKNYLEVKEKKIAVFTIKDLKENRYLDMEELIETCKKLDLPMVEIIEKGDNFNYSVSQLKQLSKGNYPGSKNPREGLVFRLQKEWFLSLHARISFKIINDDFLLKEK